MWQIVRSHAPPAPFSSNESLAIEEEVLQYLPCLVISDKGTGWNTEDEILPVLSGLVFTFTVSPLFWHEIVLGKLNREGLKVEHPPEGSHPHLFLRRRRPDLLWGQNFLYENSHTHFHHRPPSHGFLLHPQTSSSLNAGPW